MVDKPHDLIEKWLTDFTDFFNGMSADFKEITAAGYEPVHAWFKKHKFLRALFIMLIIFAIGYGVYNEATRIKEVTVVLDDSYGVITREYDTTIRRVDKFLETYDIDYDSSKDYIDKEVFNAIKDGMTINIIKSYDVTLVVDGVSHVYNSLGVTTQELLDMYDITLGPYDTIDKDFDAKLHANEVVTVERITIEIITEQTTIPFNTKYEKNTKMNVGDTVVIQQGKNGIIETDYVVVRRDGVDISKTKIEEKEVQKAQSKIIQYGTMILKTVPEDVKQSAIQVISNVKAYSYHYSGRPYGVYGLYCTYGTVAVDRKVIPLGSKLFIEGYGYAIANDVGGDIRGKTLDLYMEYRPQCSVWGARRVTVYVLEYGDNTRYWERWKIDESLKILTEYVK